MSARFWAILVRICIRNISVLSGVLAPRTGHGTAAHGAFYTGSTQRDPLRINGIGRLLETLHLRERHRLCRPSGLTVGQQAHIGHDVVLEGVRRGFDVPAGDVSSTAPRSSHTRDDTRYGNFNVASRDVRERD